MSDHEGKVPGTRDQGTRDAGMRDPDAVPRDYEDLVAEQETGARAPHAFAARAVLFATALVWSVFQLWYASPLPFLFNIFVLNDTEARSIHLAFAVFLALTAYPALKRSPRDRVPVTDWVLAAVAAFCAAYLYLFYAELTTRPGNPTTLDLVVGCVGMVLLLEATRRALGPPLMIVAIVFLIYTFAGPYMPAVIAHQGASLVKAVTHQWLTTEGVFGVALGVSTSFVFLFVLFGSLLEKAGAGNYFIQVAFSLLGHMRGGPAKAAVVSSGLTGLISGSSIANVVTTGTFTIPLMKRVGFSSEKAGAVEVASSVNGQIMPPVMGAAAFLMVEYVGIPYTQVIKHAFLPAIITYIALIYIVHLEAAKAGMQGLPKPKVRPWKQALIIYGLVVSSIIIVAVASYYAIRLVQQILGDAAAYPIALVLFAAYFLLLWFESRQPELHMDDPNAPIVTLPETGPTVKAGLHYILPIVVLVWTLMVEQLSPGLSAFWASVFLIFILVTQRPILAFFRGDRSISAEARGGFNDLIDGLVTGARNMVGIGVATAAAGIIVGTVTLTGIGAVMTDLVELISGGNLMLMLIFTAIISLILGMGLPTTANYIVVSTLMAPVIVALGAQSGLLVPLIAVHLFVFYFGIMADVTPPVGLASFAAAAVSGGDPMRTGFVAFFYSLRTVVLPFIFIFNTDLLLVNVDSIPHAVLIFFAATISMLVFTAATMNYFLVKSRIWESLALLLVAFTLIRPGFWMDMIAPPFERQPGSQVAQVAASLEPGEKLRLNVAGFDRIGNPRDFTAQLAMGEGATGEERLQAVGLELVERDGKTVVDLVTFGSDAEKAGLDFDHVITSVDVPQARPNKELMFIPALLLLALVFLLQWRRSRSEPAAASPPRHATTAG